MANIESIISIHNKEVIPGKKAINSNCINKPDCPFSNQCQITNIAYKVKITSNLRNWKKIPQNQRIYIDIHRKSFDHEKHVADTDTQPQVQFHILKRCRPTKRTGSCYLCLNEKLFMIKQQENDILNQRSELTSKSRHKNRFKLMELKT